MGDLDCITSKGLRIVSMDDRFVILNCNGVPLNPQDASAIVEVLAEQYPPSQYLYIGFDPASGLHKVGISKQPYERCVNQLNIRFIHSIECRHPLYTARQLEAWIHEQLRQRGLQIKGEWFQLGKQELLLFTKTDSTEDLIAAVTNGWNIRREVE